MGLLKRLQAMKTGLEERFWKALERPLRFDEVANERRMARMGSKRIEIALWAWLILTFVVFFATPAWQVAYGGPWEARWRIASLGSGIALVALLTYMWWQGRPQDVGEELRRASEALEAPDSSRERGKH